MNVMKDNKQNKEKTIIVTILVTSTGNNCKEVPDYLGSGRLKLEEEHHLDDLLCPNDRLWSFYPWFE